MTEQPEPPVSPIRVGVSACLLGQRVRYDGGHKADRFIIETLGRYFCWVPVCPEMEIGLGTPRETLRLAGDATAPSLVATVSGNDHTPRMQRFAAQRLSQLAELGLHGYILKKHSPSCGMTGVRVYDVSGKPHCNGRGLFARALMVRLPVEEEGRLQDPGLREHFIERVYACHRWLEFLASNPAPRDMVQFHTRHKLSLMAHSRSHYQALGRMVVQCGEGLSEEFLEAYGDLFRAALKVRATCKKHANVLSHVQGYVSKHLGKPEKAALAACIDDYRRGLVPLTAPLDLLRDHFRRHPCPYVEAQTYLDPYPADLMRLLHA
jgi:uncharacterized protein YbgA (DUF1722 family)/uncharacterized protein YbbK (DUF523 family)